MVLNDEVLEIRVISFRGRIIHKDKARLVDKNKMANLFRTLNIKFDLGLEKIIKETPPDWFLS